MMYKCPKCHSPRGREVLRRKTDKMLILTITYESGCEMKLERTGSSWVMVKKKCTTS